MARILDLESFEVFEIPEEFRDAARGQIVHFRTVEEHVFAVEAYRIVHGTPGWFHIAPCTKNDALDPCQMMGHAHNYPTGPGAAVNFYMRRIILIPDTDEECRRVGFRMCLHFKCPGCGADSSVNVYLLDMLEFYYGLSGRNIGEIFPYLAPPDRELFLTKTCRRCWAREFGKEDTSAENNPEPEDMQQREREFAGHLREEEQHGFQLVGCFYCRSTGHSTHACRDKDRIDRFWYPERYSSEEEHNV
jgi:hypothetical protein